MPISTIKKTRNYNQVFIVLISLFFLLAFAPTLYAAIYYVDATLGKDTNDGLSQTAAWKTIAKVNASNFFPGDQILFKKGEGPWGRTLSGLSSDTITNHFTDFVLEWKSVKYN